MNATQGKVLLNATRKALAILNASAGCVLLAHPEDLAELRQAIEQASITASKGKCVLCEGSMNPADGVDGFIGRKLKLGLAHETCARKYREVAVAFKADCDTRRQVRAWAFDVAKMSLCACGHPANSHEEDEIGNLLQCRDSINCDCDHFHYEINAEESEAV